MGSVPRFPSGRQAKKDRDTGEGTKTWVASPGFSLFSSLKSQPVVLPATWQPATEVVIPPGLAERRFISDNMRHGNSVDYTDLTIPIRLGTDNNVYNDARRQYGLGTSGAVRRPVDNDLFVKAVWGREKGKECCTYRPSATLAWGRDTALKTTAELFGLPRPVRDRAARAFLDPHGHARDLLDFMTVEMATSHENSHVQQNEQVFAVAWERVLGRLNDFVPDRNKNKWNCENSEGRVKQEWSKEYRSIRPDFGMGPNNYEDPVWQRTYQEMRSVGGALDAVGQGEDAISILRRALEWANTP